MSPLFLFVRSTLRNNLNHVRNSPGYPSSCFQTLRICQLTRSIWSFYVPFTHVSKWLNRQNVVHCRRKWQTTSTFLHWEPHEQCEKQKDRTSFCPILKDELPRSVSAQYTTGDEWRNNSRKNEQTEPKQKQHPVVDVTGDGSKVRCCKEQCCIGTWNVRSMKQGKLEVVKQEMARVNVDILGISELKIDWNGWI